MARYSAAEVTARQRARARRRMHKAAGTVIAIVLIAGNVALLAYRDEVTAWVRRTFGGVELVIEKRPPQE